MPQGWKGFRGACGERVQRQKNLIIVTNVRGHYIPLSPFLSKPEAFCLSLRYLEFPSMSISCTLRGMTFSYGVPGQVIIYKAFPQVHKLQGTLQNHHFFIQI